ncbi:hypothetical protein BHM03_00060976, partial [Ensete ventricosum]
VAASLHRRPQAWLAPIGAPPAGVGNARGQVARGSHPRPGRKEWLPAARPHGVAAPAGAAPAQGGTARPRGAARGQ